MRLELRPCANPSPAFAQGCQFEERVGCDPFVPLEEKKCAAGKNSISKSFFFLIMHLRADDKGAVSLGGTKE